MTEVPSKLNSGKCQNSEISTINQGSMVKSPSTSQLFHVQPLIQWASTTVTFPLIIKRESKQLGR